MANDNQNSNQNGSKEKRTLHALPLVDLTPFKTAEELAVIESIHAVPVVLVPESLMSAFYQIKLGAVASIVPVPDGDNVRVQVMNGSVRMSGETFGEMDPNQIHVLVVNGSLTFTSPLEKIGYARVVANGPVLVPEGSEAAVQAAITTLNGPMISYPTGKDADVHIHEGQVTLTSEIIANTHGNENDVLVASGQVVIEGPIEGVGYKKIFASGQVIAPRGILSSYMTVEGHAIWYRDNTPRVFNHTQNLAPAFFEYLPKPVTMIINGDMTIEEGTTIESVREKVAEIILTGVLEAPAELIPLLQVLITQNDGKLYATGTRPAKEGK